MPFAQLREFTEKKGGCPPLVPDWKREKRPGNIVSREKVGEKKGAPPRRGRNFLASSIDGDLTERKGGEGFPLMKKETRKGENHTNP